jgi:hypothetical protein
MSQRDISILEERKTIRYRILESALGTLSLSFLFLILFLSFVRRDVAAVILIVYSFLWVLKFALNSMYTIYTYLQLKRWESFKWNKFAKYLDNGQRDQVKGMIKEFRDTYKGKIDWYSKLNKDMENWIAISGSEYENPMEMYHVAIFSIYNESVDVIERSLKSIYDAKYPYQKIIVVISQEERVGEDHVKNFKKGIKQFDWLRLRDLNERDLKKVYHEYHSKLRYTNPKFSKYKLYSDKLNVFFTTHPDGLIGEIKGKASNEDWGGRQASLLTKSLGINPRHVLVTSLDADSHVGVNFFHNLSYTYCLNEDKETSGYQPVHVYSNNFFETGIWQRQIATQNTLTNMMYLGIEDETHFFAIYSVPLFILQDINFWVREVIAEDFMIYAKCLAHYQGKFKVVPFYGVFEGDAIEADDYIEAIINQYKQLQRWTWGGVESFAYLYTKLFFEENGRKIDLRKRIKYITSLFAEHFFWASTPLILSVGVVLPQFIGGEQFRQTPISQNLSLFITYFAWISFVFIIIFSFITFRYIASKAVVNKKRTVAQNFLILLQWLVMPLVFGFASIPALDSQIRGIRGKYLGYWVSPKK